ncbi:MAG: voltage-gated chloride channel protein [Actinomycetia bacterium]|nr:voltage-gated chloride channel protein [Actinomycetes bacterium]
MVQHRREPFRRLRELAQIHLGEQVRIVVYLVRWVVLGSVSGVLAGLASALFLVTLDWATDTRLSNPWLLYLLPVAGLAVGCVYRYLGGRSAGGNELIIEEIHEPTEWIPRRMAPLVYAGSVVTQLFGGSAGREGTAIQMSGSLTDGFSRLVHLDRNDRRMMLIAAIAGGFGAVFGVPIAGCVFALEVQAVGRMRYDALVPALAASLVGDLVVRGVGVTHAPLPQIGAVDLTPLLIGKFVLAGLIFGLTSILFIEATHAIKHVLGRTVRWSPARLFVGGLAVILLVAVVGNRDYLGLSIPLLTASLAGGAGVVGAAFLWKLLFTAVTLGSGFPGGEVTPLFVMGATLGVTLARLLGVPVPLMAAVGFVAVFAAAANTPLACTIMGIELFGSGPAVLFAVACVVAYIFSSHRGIYGSQRVDTSKGPPGMLAGLGPSALTLHHLLQRRAAPPEDQ